MDSYNIHRFHKPRIMFLALIALGVFYIVSLGSIIGSTFLSVYPRVEWFGLFRAEDALYVLKTMKDARSPLPATWITIAVALHKENAPLLFAVSEYMLSQQDEAQGMVFLEKANRLNPYNKDMRNRWMELLVDHGDTPRAIKDLQSRGFEGLNEKWTPALYHTGLELIKEGKSEEALVLWYVAAEISPSWSHIWIEYASLSYSLGRAELARSILERCSRDPFAGPHCRTTLEKFDRGEILEPGRYSYIFPTGSKDP